MWIEEQNYWKERKERTKFNVPSLGEEIYIEGEKKLVPETGPKMPVELQEQMIKLLKVFFPCKDELNIEVFTENESVRFRILSGYNPGLFRSLSDLNKIEAYLSTLRCYLNDYNPKFKRCKLFYLRYDCEKEMDSFNIVFNANWKKYENYEILFRSKTQLRRARES